MDTFSQPESMQDNLMPGSLVHIGEQKIEKPRIRMFDFTKEELKETEVSQIEDILPVAQKEDSVTWINVDGIHDVDLFKKIQEHFQIHPLVLENVLNTASRPKFEAHENYVFIVLKSIRFESVTEKVVFEQLSFILGANYVLSFQERPGTFLIPFGVAFATAKAEFAIEGRDYLCYALVDAIVDNYYKLPEALSQSVDTIESRVLAGPSPEDLEAIYNLKREIVILDRTLWPVVELVNGMKKDESGLISENLGLFLDDLLDHAGQLVSSVRTIRDMVSNLQDLYMSVISNSMNQVMKVLAVIATIFIPLTFLAGIFGMNFEFMPELKIKGAYFVTLVVMFVIAVGMVMYFKRKKWL